MTKLNDTQIILLSQASQRQDQSLLPVPATIRTPARTVTKLLAALAAQGLAEERPVRDAAQVWREDGDDRFGLFLTDAGLAAIDGTTDISTAAETDDDASVSPLAANQPSAALPKHAKAAAPSIPTSQRTGSKKDLLIAMLQSPEGASIEAMTEAFGWQAHSARAMLTGLRKAGHNIERAKLGDVTIYRLVA